MEPTIRRSPSRATQRTEIVEAGHLTRRRVLSGPVIVFPAVDGAQAGPWPIVTETMYKNGLWLESRAWRAALNHHHYRTVLYACRLLDPRRNPADRYLGGAIASPFGGRGEHR